MILWNYMQNTHSFVTAKHIIQQRGFNKYLNYICARMTLQLQCNIAFQSTKEKPLTMYPTGVFIDSRKRPLGFPTLRLPDCSASLRPWKNMRPATCGSDCDLRLRCRCDFRPVCKCDLWPGDGCNLRLKKISYGGGRVIERFGASIFFPLRKSRQAW